MDTVRRVYLRYAFSRDPKIVVKEFDKLRGALKHLEHAQGELTEGANFHAYSQAIDSYRDVKFFLEHAGVPSIEHETKAKALGVLSKNPFNPAQALEESKAVFKDALAEVDALEAEFGKAGKPKSASSDFEAPKELLGALKGWNLSQVKLVYRLLAAKHKPTPATVSAAIDQLETFRDEQTEDDYDKRNANKAITQLLKL